MGTSDERYNQLVKKDWDEEWQAWKLFRFELQRRWDLLYPGFRDKDYILEVDDVTPVGDHSDAHQAERFLKEQFTEMNRGWFQENVIGEADGLIFRPRQRLRSRYHCSLTEAPSPGFFATSAGPRIQSRHLYLTPASLAAGMKVAGALDYAVTLSTPRAGASERSFHFLAMPRVLQFDGRRYQLYHWLEDPHRRIVRLTESPECAVDLVVYHAFCIRIHGAAPSVARLVHRLAREYHDLVAFNLVILRKATERSEQYHRAEPSAPDSDIEHSSVFFFPRPWRPTWEGPTSYKDRPHPWSFGAFEMGGFFLHGDTDIFREMTYRNLSSILYSEVSIWQCAKEREQLARILRDSLSLQDVGEKVEMYSQECADLARWASGTG